MVIKTLEYISLFTGVICAGLLAGLIVTFVSTRDTHVYRITCIQDGVMIVDAMGEHVQIRNSYVSFDFLGKRMTVLNATCTAVQQ